MVIVVLLMMIVIAMVIVMYKFCGRSDGNRPNDGNALP